MSWINQIDPFSYGPNNRSKCTAALPTDSSTIIKGETMRTWTSCPKATGQRPWQRRSQGMRRSPLTQRLHHHLQHRWCQTQVLLKKKKETEHGRSQQQKEDRRENEKSWNHNRSSNNSAPNTGQTKIARKDVRTEWRGNTAGSTNWCVFLIPFGLCVPQTRAG